MNTSLLPHVAALALLAATAVAQVPADSAIVLLDVPVQQNNLPPAFVLVDVLGRGHATVRNQSVYAARTSVSVDPTDASRVFYETSATSLGGTWTAAVRGLAEFGINTWGSLGRDASERVEAGGVQVFTLRAGQVFAVLKSGGANTAIASIGASVDLAVRDPEVFVLTRNPGIGSQVFAVHSQTRAVRALATLPPSSAIAWSPTGELIVGADDGTLLRVDPTNGNVTGSNSTGTGTFVALTATRFGTAVWTDGVRVYSEILGAVPIYTASFPILDLAAPRTTAASLMPYGQSCAAPRTVEWTFPSQPTLGNTNFRIGLRAGTPNTPALLCLGLGFSFSSVFGQPLPIALQPLGLGTCLLHCDPILQSGIALDGTGAASVLAPIPNDPALAGASFGMQWFGVQQGSNALSLVGSEGVAAQVF